MKKKIIIPILICFIIIGIIGFIIWNNRIVSTITLDINPSIEINLNNDNKVKNIKALNNDAKDIINNIKGNTLEEIFNLLIINLVEKGYVKETNNLDVILHVDGKITNESIAEKIEFEFGKKDIHTEIIIIDNITKEDIKLAKKYNVSPAKASYIKSITQENEKINIEDLVDKKISELNETKSTGKYCSAGYVLEGDWCLKEINRLSAKIGNVCPSDYVEYNGKCYEEVQAIETSNYICHDDFKLVNDKCVLEDINDAMGNCDSGSYDVSSGYCINKEYVGDATEFCRLTPETDLLIDHKCYGPKPTINGGCLYGDKLINGSCVDMNSYYKSDWKCPNGDFLTNPDGTLMNGDIKCYNEIKTKPTSYYCEGDGKLNGTKCEFNVIEDALKEYICPSGYTPIDDGRRCLDFNKTINTETGYYCEGENSRLEGQTCIIYDMVEAKN